MYTCCCCCGQQRLTHCDSMDCSPPGSSVHRICQALGDYAMAIHSSTLAWKIPWTEEPSRLQSLGSLRVGHDRATSLSLFIFHFHALEKEMATHSSVLAWRIPGMGEPGGLPSMGSHRVGHDRSDLAAAAVSLYMYSIVLKKKLRVSSPPLRNLGSLME